MATRGRPRKKISIEDITREINVNGLTVTQVAELFKVSPDTVLRRMKEASKANTKSSGSKSDSFFAGFGPWVKDEVRRVEPEAVRSIPAADTLAVPLPDNLIPYKPAYGPFGTLLKEKVPDPEVNGKKVGEFNIDDWFDWIETGQALRKQASWSGTTGPITLGDGSGPIVLSQLGDTHLGSWGTDHRLVRTAFNEIRDIDGLFVALMGDLDQMSIKLRSVIEVSDNLLPPDLQAQFIEALLDMIVDKIAFSSWCNHAIEREQNQSGTSLHKYLLNRRSPYFDGIGHPDIKVGDQIYKFACSHKFKGNTQFDSTAGPKRYLRLEAPDREICLQGDLHRPGIAQYTEGGSERIAMTNGTHQLHSGYAERYFSLRAFPIMPSLVLYPDKHRAVPYWNLDEALKSLGR